MSRRTDDLEAAIKRYLATIERQDSEIAALERRIHTFGREHTPCVSAQLMGRTVGEGSFFADQPLVYCTKCRAEWPCAPYLWATESQPFRLVMRPRPEGPMTHYRWPDDAASEEADHA